MASKKRIPDPTAEQTTQGVENSRNDAKATRKKAKTFTHGTTQRGNKQQRKRLLYYLDDALYERMKRAIEKSGLQKREFVIEAIHAFFTGRRYKTEVDAMVSSLPLHKRRHLSDEVPCPTWQRVEEFCLDRSYKKIYERYKVIECAILEAVTRYEATNDEE